MLSGTPRIACKPFRDRIADFSLRIDYDGAPAVHVEHVSRDIDSARLSHLGDEVKYDIGHQEQRDARRAPIRPSAVTPAQCPWAVRCPAG